MKINYHFKGEENVYSPQLVYYKDIIEQNIDKMIQFADDPFYLWPHIKTYKMKEVIELMMKKGINKFKCATIGELELLCTCHVSKIFLAYPLVGPNIERFVSIVKAYPDIEIFGMADDFNQAKLLGKCAIQKSININLLLDTDVGQHRTGIPFSKIKKSVLLFSNIKGITLRGLHCYDGHTHESSEKIRYEKTSVLDAKINKLVKQLQINNSSFDTIILGGTPSFLCHKLYTNFYCSPGTCIIQDAGYEDNYKDLNFVPAAAVLTRVISHPTANTFTIDCGTKAIASDPIGQRCKLIDCPHAKMIMHNEEHMVFQLNKKYLNETPPIGKVLYAIPVHVCPTTILYPEVVVVENKKKIGTWKVAARDRKITY